MALADQASRRFAQAVADAASVLAPEQRRKLADRIDTLAGLRASLASRLFPPPPNRIG